MLSPSALCRVRPGLRLLCETVRIYTNVLRIQLPATRCVACISCNTSEISKRGSSLKIPFKFCSSPGNASKTKTHVEISLRAICLSNVLGKSKVKKGKKAEVIIRQEDAEEYADLNSIHQQMLKIVATMKDDYTRNFRVGADSKLLDQITVSLEGDDFQLREVARITKKSPRVLELDFVSFPEALDASEAAIRSSGLNFNPAIKGTKIEVPIPEVTAEHRKVLAKAAKKQMNDAKDELRKVRNSVEKSMGKIEKIPKDVETAIKKQVQVYLDEQTKDAEEAFKLKEKELTLQ